MFTQAHLRSHLYRAGSQQEQQNYNRRVAAKANTHAQVGSGSNSTGDLHTAVQPVLEGASLQHSSYHCPLQHNSSVCLQKSGKSHSSLRHYHKQQRVWS